jgi:glucosamine--fructose-6-phosphate aminotransferase (isomerizing)
MWLWPAAGLTEVKQMCGIIGYVGHKEALGLLLEGLKRLEYRGYDSAGVAIQDDGHMKVAKSAGRISVLERRIVDQGPDSMSGTTGIAHTRWATHGAPNDINAHPHCNADDTIAIVHNGIIDNYRSIRTFLSQKDIEFRSSTDSEVIAHLIAYYYDSDLESATRRALQDIQGTYGIVATCSKEPGVLVAARNGSPLIVGIGEGEYVIASDASAILEHTSQVIYLADNEMARVCQDGFRTTTLDAVPITKDVEEVEWTLDQIELDGHQYFMEKEIFEQPSAVENCMRGRVDLRDGTIHLGGIADCARELVRAKRIILTGCGTAWHAALVGEYLLEDLAHLPAETEYASEFRYRNPIIEDGTIVIAVSQSGETADTLAALVEARQRGALALGAVNVVGSSIARQTDAGVYLHVGPETGVASTKAFSGQVTVLTLLALFLGRRRIMSRPNCQEYLEALVKVPAQIGQILQQNEQIRECTQAYVERNNWLYLGRGYNYPVALEGALKLKEISYIHAEGLPAAEMKHGPIALITEGMPVVFIATAGSQYEKIKGNIEEVRSRGGHVIAVATEGDREIAKMAEHVLFVPHAPEALQPLLTVIPLQLIAYHAAVLRGCNVDKPRNLAKSVTVE